MKRFLKIFFSILLIVSLYSAWGIILANKEESRIFFQNTFGINRPCRKPLSFSIGSVDPRFGITLENIALLSQESAGIWNQAAGKDVLLYQPGADFKINLVFDERQAATLKAKELEDKLKNIEASHEGLAKQYESLNQQYERKVEAYKKELREYKKSLEKYNEKVEYWNDRGGAPEEEYEKLKDEKERLSDELDKLEKQRAEINKLAGKSNYLAVEEDKVIGNYNANLKTYKSIFGSAREFEKGIFEGKEINIYQFEEETDLRLTLIHELGHYLGLDHVENPLSLMYYLIGEQDLESPRLSNEDLAELRKVCGISNR